jgi:hypothetical protein
VAFRCKGRQFCPSCHARRLAEWSVWLEEHLLAPVAHRQVVLTVPRCYGWLIEMWRDCDPELLAGRLEIERRRSALLSRPG